MPNKVVVSLLDLSESTNKPEIRSKYSEAFQLILFKITHGDALIVGLITEKSVTELDIPIREQFPKFSPKHDTRIYIEAEAQVANEELEKKKKSIKARADSILNDKSKKILKTDILSSLVVAERIFSNYLLPKKVLVIMSDMIEDSADYNFEIEKLSDKRINEIIEKEKARARIPNLNGAKVYVIGASARTLDQYYFIQNFWLRYFKECGADLSKENYGSALLAFKE